MSLPPEADKVWQYTGVIVYGYEIQSNPHENEFYKCNINHIKRSNAKYVNLTSLPFIWLFPFYILSILHYFIFFNTKLQKI